ncbi:hypothetical protein FM102_01650 [Corynebacterium glutamicum]|uniref:hypothetical protein n=1 Tax=Corynebacterium glutamicum TaxID=1718 RepID=UPI00097ED5A0|nr:hypothetical protein [Corynebacterium glutamicum]SJM45821.1 hypothetical protein FM102_01650 [Corynebacterium glutamicum]
MSHTVPFGDGWIQVLEDAAETVSITDTLDALRFSPEQAEWAAEIGLLLCFEATAGVSHGFRRAHEATA